MENATKSSGYLMVVIWQVPGKSKFRVRTLPAGFHEHDIPDDIFGNLTDNHLGITKYR